MSIFKKSILIFLIGLWLPLIVINAQEGKVRQASQSTSDLAHIAIVNFQDNTQKNEYNWVSKSLPDAIFSSMQKKFEFIRMPTDSTSSSAFPVLSKSSTNDKKQLSEYTKKIDADMVIFGSYTYSSSSDTLLITAQIFHKEGRKVLLKTTVESKLDNSVFTKIDDVAIKIVDRIYKYAIDLEETKKKKDQNKIINRIRILVLVPSWENETEKNVAENELHLLKNHLANTYNARFLTLDEFYREKKIPFEEQTKVNIFAKDKNKNELIKWLQIKGIKNAIIIFVSNSLVSITPIVNSQVKPKAEFGVNDPLETKSAIFISLSQSSSLDSLLTQNDKKVALKKEQTKQIKQKNSKEKTNTKISDDKIKIKNSHLFWAGGLTLPTLASSEFVNLGFHLKGGGFTNYLYSWLYPFAEYEFRYLPGNGSTSLNTTMFQALVGLYYPTLNIWGIQYGATLTFGINSALIKGSDKGLLINPLIQVGSIARYKFYKNLYALSMLNVGYIVDTKVSTLLISVSVGFSYAFNF